MLTGRFTYGLGQVDQSSVFSAFMNTPISQTPVAQNPPIAWGGTEWFLVGLAGYIVYSVFSKTKQTVGRTRGYLAERRERIAREAEATADYYRARKKH